MAIAHKIEQNKTNNLNTQKCTIDSTGLVYPIESKFIPYSKYFRTKDSRILYRREKDKFYDIDNHEINVEDNTLPIPEGTVLVGLLLDNDNRKPFQRFYPITALLTDDDGCVLYSFKEKQPFESFTRSENIINLCKQGFLNLRNLTAKKYCGFLRKAYTNYNFDLYRVNEKRLKKLNFDIRKIEDSGLGWELTFYLYNKSDK